MNRSAWPQSARVLTSPWLLAPLLVLALLVGAFAGYGAWTRSQPTDYARGGDFGLTDPGTAAGSTPTPSATSTTKAKRGRPTPSARAGSPVGSSRPAAAAVAGAAAARSGTSGSPVGPVLPRTGTYQLQVSGSEHVKFGPFSACTNTFPSSTELVVQRAAGEGGGAYDFDQRFFPGSPNKHDERHIYRFTADVVTLTYEQATVTCGGVKQSTTVTYAPAQPKVRLPLAVGATWHSRGGDSGRIEDETVKVVGSTRLSVAGTSYLTYVIDTHVDMSGSETGTRDQRWWYAPDLGVPLQWQETLSGSRSGATYSEHVTCAVTSLPAR